MGKRITTPAQMEGKEPALEGFIGSTGRGVVMDSGGESHIFFRLDDMIEHGILWLINRQVFHPRGYALVIVVGEDEGGNHTAGWYIDGDGSEPWSISPDAAAIEDERFRRIKEMLP